MAIYFDNAATTPMSQEVIDAMLPFMDSKFGNPSAVHSMGRPVRAAIERGRKKIASLINVSPSEICFTSCGTEANNTALMGAVRDLGVKRIISSPIEHHCILHTLEFLEKVAGLEVIHLPVDKKGHIDYKQLEDLIAEDKQTLVSLMHGNNEIGTMVDFERVSELCRDTDTFFHSDTVQTFGHFEFDLQKTPIDFMVCSAHKLHGPKGIGFLYINGNNKISPMLFGGSQERNMRAGTENVIGIVGLAKATELAYEHLETERAHSEGLKFYLKDQLLAEFDDIQFNGDPDGRSLYHVLSVSFPGGPKNDMLLFNLDIAGICASGGSACSSGSIQKSHVLAALGADPDRVCVRFSFSKINKKEEVDTLIETLKKIMD